MAQIRQTNIQAALTVLLELNEDEVRALSRIFGYSVDHFLKVFYEKMGEAYVKPYEKGVRSLHGTIRQLMADPIAKITEARRKLKS
jgi:hypothetical protein